ncbi:hypothetical protein AB0M95_18380 [Sphaerisporangium sp. NPDC051017]|uniref:hypothetical protein n=1 Tax=Sphaerisporangium sp. NPDC051017 TaxID=3154636 RepID=UPI0034124349
MRLDAELYQVADALQRDTPDWVIMWAPWRRKFCAFSRRPLATNLIVQATTPERLLALIRQVEDEMRDAL